MMRLSLLSVALASVVIAPALGFSTTPFAALTRLTSPCSVHVLEATREKVTVEPGFIEQELRGAAMKLHTKSQAPKEGQATETSRVEPHVTTLEDYLQFLVDSQHVYQAMEDIVNQEEQLTMFRNTRLERTEALEKDVEFMCQEYGLTRPEVGVLGKEYAQELRRIAASGNIPEFMCHYYNFYFAHTAGGRMIGKQMAALLLDKKTLEFYKWDGDLNEIKAAVKQNIEDMAARWTREEKDECVKATPAAFRGGGMINANLAGKRSM